MGLDQADRAEIGGVGDPVRHLGNFPGRVAVQHGGFRFLVISSSGPVRELEREWRSTFVNIFKST